MKKLIQRKPCLYFIGVWVVIFAAYLPIFLGSWPGNFVFDAKYQLANVITDSYSTHHPLLHTLLMGWAYKFGLKINNVSAGYQFYTLFQMLVLSSSFAYFIYYLYRRKAPKAFRIGALLWFALFPMHSIFAISATKDVLFAAFFLYTIVFMMRFLYENDTHDWKNYVCLIVSGILAMLFRNNGMHAILVGCIFIAVLGKKLKFALQIILLMVVMLIGYKTTDRILINATKAWTPDTYKESMSMPLQCLARVACYRRADIKEEHYQEICSYINEESLQNYSPYNADPIKNNANELLLKENTINFFKLWGKVGLAFPDEYLESIITNTVGYWYPLNRGEFALAEVALYHTLIGLGEEITKECYCPPAGKIYTYLFYFQKYKETPLIGYLFRSDAYIWLLVYLLLWAIYKKSRKIIQMTMIPVMYLGTCFLGPMSALRYVYSLIVLTPVFLYLIMQNKDGGESVAP